MNKLKLAIIGLGGRTGTMFAYELNESADVLAVGREKKIGLVAGNELSVQRNGKQEIFNVRLIQDSDFSADLAPDAILVATKNPVRPVIRYYFEKFKGKKIPALILSQNGIEAVSDAKEALKEIFGAQAESISIVRSVLFNPIEQVRESENTIVKYSLPVRMAVSQVQGEGVKEIVEIFRNANFEVDVFQKRDAQNIAYSKLFLNLIGMASAANNLSVEHGFKDRNVFRQEIAALKEYIGVVKKAKGRFVNFSKYPVKTFAFLVGIIPLPVLNLFRGILAGIVSKDRKGKPKDLDEINYYNGGVVKLAKKIGMDAPVNSAITQKRA